MIMPTQKQFLDNEGLTELLDDLGQHLKSKQDTLVSGTNIKTINGNSLLGSGGIMLDCDTIPYTGEDQNYIYNGDTMADCVIQLDEAVSNKQDTLVSGTNIKTVNNNSLLGSGNITLNDAAIPYDGNAANVLEDATNVQEALDLLDDAVSNIEPNEISSITTSESSASGGNNTVTITESNGTTHTFNVKNGVDGQNGVSLGDVAIADDLETDDATKVLSAKQGKRIGDDLSRLKDYEFGEATYDEDDLFKNKSYTNNTATITGKMVNLANYGCLMLTVTKGDKVTIASYGASGPRTYSLCDNDYNVYKVAASGYDCTSNPVTIEVTKDGYCHINCRSAAYSAFAVTHYYSTERKMLDDNTRSLTSGEMDGTSRWIVDKLQALGWEYDMRVYTNGTTTNTGGYVASPFIPCDNIAGHSITFCYMHSYTSGNVALYNENKAFTTGHYFATTDVNKRTVDINAGWTSDVYIRMTCNPDKLAECYIYDNTDKVYIWKGSDYLGVIYEDNLVSFKTFRDVLVEQEVGESTLKTMSQKAITEYSRKVTAEDLAGTSDWIKARLTEEGWLFGKELTSTGGVGNSASCCVTGFIPMEDFFCNNISIVNKTTSAKWACWYDEDKIFVKAWSVNSGNTGALTDTNYKNAKYVRITLNPLKLQETYIYDNSTQEWFYRWENYVINILSSNLTASKVGELFPLKKSVDDSIGLIGRRSFGATSVFDAMNKSEMCWSKKRYNISSKPWVDVVCYNASPGNAQRSCWFGFSPSISSSKPSTLPDYIGFVDNVWSMDFIVRRNGTTVHTTTKALDSFSGGAVAFGCRFDFRRKFVQVAWRSTGGVYNSSTIDLSAYDIDLGYCYMCTTIGYCSYAADLYVSWNGPTNMSDFSAYFSSPLMVGKFKKFAEFMYPPDSIDGSIDRQFTNLMTNWSATQDANGHWVASIDVSAFTAMMHNQPNVSGFLYNNWDLQIWIGKIKATNGDLQFKQRYTTIKDVYDLTDEVFLTAVSDVYTITSGHTVEVRMKGNINGRGQMLSFLGTCTVEMWDWEVHVAMNTNITPENYDGKKIFGGMEFLFDFPNLIVDLPLMGSSNYYAQGFMKLSSNKVYARVYDTSTNTYVDKQISNT